MGKQVLGVEFVPLHVPLKRRMQTLAALLSTYLFFFGGFTSILFLGYLLFKTRFWWIAAAYFSWLLYDWKASSRGGHRREFMRRWKFHDYLRDYFPVSLVKTADLDPSQKYIMGYHPHGVMVIGSMNFTTESTGFSKLFPGITPYVLTLRLLHLLPFYREWLSSLGYCDVSKESIEHILSKKGNAAIIVIGGAKESMDAEPHKTTIVLKGRKGFVKMALKQGAHLVPIFSFGENDIFKLALTSSDPDSLVRKMQRFFQKKAGFAPLVVFGRGIFNYTFGFVPFRKPITTVVGSPIKVDQDTNPTQDKIDELHNRYMRALEDLFNQHKEKYGYGDKTLNFVS